MKPTIEGALADAVLLHLQRMGRASSFADLDSVLCLCGQMTREELRAGLNILAKRGEIEFKPGLHGQVFVSVQKGEAIDDRAPMASDK